jgi:tRNA (guanine-N7-)-methyltransferase
MFKRIYNKIYYKYFAPIKYHTVVLRGGLTEEERRYTQEHLRLLKNKSQINNDNTERKILEIGFGNGNHLKSLCERFSGKNSSIYGLELDSVGIFKFLKSVDSNNYENITVVREDARTFITSVPRNFFNTIFVLYSDPWPRKRDFKRRLINKDFLLKCLDRVKIGGQVILATDILSYQEQIEDILHLLKLQYVSAYEEEIANIKSEFDLKEVFKTKFALRAKKEGRRSKVFIVPRV